MQNVENTCFIYNKSHSLAIIINASLVDHAQMIQVAVVLIVVHAISNYKYIWDNKADIVSKIFMNKILNISLVEKCRYSKGCRAETF